MKLFCDLNNIDKKTIVITEKQARHINEKKYHINTDIENDKDYIYPVKISVDEFKNKLIDIYDKYKDEYGGKPSVGGFIHRFCSFWKSTNQYPELKQLAKDIKVVNADGENCDIIGDIRTIKNGIPYVIAQKGGDWEIPVLFIVYYDGNNIRAYFPKKGNTINLDDMTAFQGISSERDKNMPYLKKQFPDKTDDELIKISEKLHYNIDLCIKDFEEHIKKGKKIAEECFKPEELLFESLLFEAELKDIYQKYYTDIPEETFWNVVKADPTYNPQKEQKMGKYGRWLLNLFRQNKLKPEDLYKATDYLSYFNKYYNKIQQKDINQYNSLPLLYNTIKPFKDAADKGEEMATSKSDEIRKIKEDAELFYEDDIWKVIIPHTQEAACYYGKNTEWCTAATSSYNMFNQYYDEGLLYINICKKNNKKYQFHFESCQFMDENDNSINVPIVSNIPLTQGLIKKYVERYKGKALLLLTKPVNFFDEGDEAIQGEDPYYAYIDYDGYVSIVQTDGLNVRYLDASDLTYENNVKYLSNGIFEYKLEEEQRYDSDGDPYPDREKYHVLFDAKTRQTINQKFEYVGNLNSRYIMGKTIINHLTVQIVYDSSSLKPVYQTKPYEHLYTVDYNFRTVKDQLAKYDDNIVLSITNLRSKEERQMFGSYQKKQILNLQTGQYIVSPFHKYDIRTILLDDNKYYLTYRSTTSFGDGYIPYVIIYPDGSLSETLTENKNQKQGQIINESNNSFDLDIVEQINYTKDYIEEENTWSYNITCYDLDGNECLSEYDLTYDEMVNYIGEENAKYIHNAVEEEGTFWNEPKTTPSNIDDVNEVNKIAKKVFRVTEYYAGMRGYLLTDGSFIYFGPDVDHVSITRIDGMTIGKFISLGNIRIGDCYFELEKLPTFEQKKQLYKLIGDSNEVFVDICKYQGKGQYPNTIDSAKFKGGNPKLILNQIDRFFNEGIKMSSNNYNNEELKKELNLIIEQKIREILFEQYLLEANLEDIYSKYYSNIPQEEFWQIVKSDPTWNEQSAQKMGKYSKWLLNQYKQGKLKLEDLYKYKESLEAFHKFNNKLENKDIMSYTDGNALYQAVKQFIDNPEQSTSKSDEIRKTKQDIEKVYEDDEWVILIPKTEEAAKCYGKGTRWCTAADNDNRFNQYNNDGPLFININKKNGEKYQFHFESNQLMDSSDTPINGIIADEIGLSEGAKKYYDSISKGFEINGEFAENGWKVSRSEEDGWISVYTPYEQPNNKIEIDVNYGDIINENNNDIKQPLNKIFPVSVLKILQKQMKPDAFYNCLLGTDNNIYGYAATSYPNKFIQFYQTDADFANGYNVVIYNLNEDFSYNELVNLTKYGFYVDENNIKNFSGKQLNVIIPKTKKKNIYLIENNSFVFNENVDKICNKTFSKNYYAIDNNNAIIKTDKGENITIPSLNNELKISNVFNKGNIAIISFGDGEYRLFDSKDTYGFYIINQRRYALNQPVDSYTQVENRDKMEEKGIMVKEKQERSINYNAIPKEIITSFSLSATYYPQSELPVILNDGTVMSRTQYWQSQGILDTLLQIWNNQ